MAYSSRRQFLKRVGAGTAAFMFSGIGSFERFAFAAEPLYKGVTYLPPAYRAIRYGIDGFVDNLKKQPAGTMGVEFYDSGTLMKADGQLPGLKVGTIQFMFHVNTYIADEFPILGITELPGVCENLHEHGECIAMESPLWKLINRELARDNLFMLSAGGGIIEPEYIWSSEEKIASLSDLKGKRCRIMSSVGTEFLQRFGVTGIRLPSSKILLALQRRSIQATLSAVNTVVARNLQGHLKYCYQLPVTGATMAIFMLKDKWDVMPDAEKTAFWQAGLWYDKIQGEIGYKKIPREQYWPIVAKAGVEIIRPADKEKEIFVENAQPDWLAWKKQVGEKVGQQAIDLALGKV